MQISKNTGLYNVKVSPFKDNVINGNSLMYLGRNNYTDQDIDIIRKALNR